MSDWQHELIAEYGTNVVGAVIALVEDRPEDISTLYDDEHLAEYLVAATIILRSSIRLCLQAINGEKPTDDEIIATLQYLALETTKLKDTNEG